MLDVNPYFLLSNNYHINVVLLSSYNMSGQNNSINNMPPWRNWLARSAVNREVGCSSPPRSDFLTVTITREKLLFFS